VAPDHLDERIPRPLDILLRAVEERREDGKQGNTPAVNDGAVHRVSRNEHEVTCFDPPCLLADSKTTLAFQDQYNLVVIWLNVNDIHTIFEDVDVAREVLAVEQERSFDRISSGCWVGGEPEQSIFKSMEVLRAHGFLLLAAIATEPRVDVTSLRSARTDVPAGVLAAPIPGRWSRSLRNGRCQLLAGKTAYGPISDRRVWTGSVDRRRSQFDPERT